MKLNITITYHYIVFLSIALLLAPATFVRPCAKANEIKKEKNAEKPVASNEAELLHSEMLFRY